MSRKSTDKHHIFWYHKDYDRGWKKRLRDYWYCSIEIPRDTLHHIIHYEISHIPTPHSSNIKLVMEQLKSLEYHNAIHHSDTLDQRLNLLMSLFQYLEPATYEALLKQYLIVCNFYNKDPRI